MMRQAAKSPRPEDVDPAPDGDLESTDPNRTSLDLENGSHAVDDAGHDELRWETAPVPPRRRAEGLVTLILIAIVGVAIGFIAVMWI